MPCTSFVTNALRVNLKKQEFDKFGISFYRIERQILFSGKVRLDVNQKIMLSREVSKMSGPVFKKKKNILK